MQRFSSYSPGKSYTSFSSYSPGKSCTSFSSYSPGKSGTRFSSYSPCKSCTGFSSYSPGKTCTSFLIRQARAVLPSSTPINMWVLPCSLLPVAVYKLFVYACV